MIISSMSTTSESESESADEVLAEALTGLTTKGDDADDDDADDDDADDDADDDENSNNDDNIDANNDDNIDGNIDDNNDHLDYLDYYFNEINNELQYLSKLHKMKERNGDGPQKTINNNKRRSGRTRPLKPRNVIDFMDMDDDDDDNIDIDIDNEDIENIDINEVVEDVDHESATDEFHSHRNKQREQRKQCQRIRIRHQRKLFNKFARTVCLTNVIPRKEIFEAWAMALYVHYTFLSTTTTTSTTTGSTTSTNTTGSNELRRRPKIKRIADLVCSHGLLSWALLLLSSSEEVEESESESKEESESESELKEEEEEEGLEKEEKKNTTSSSTSSNNSISAVCIDIKMPKSSETVATVFKETFYKSKSKSNDDDDDDIDRIEECTAAAAAAAALNWDYVEGPIEYIIPHSSTLLVGIHACGTLSDKIIDLAISSNSSLALVPCCHTKKQFTAKQKNDFNSLLQKNQNSYTLTDFIDNYRKQKLINCGYIVHEIYLPSEFTPKNRILLCIPPTTPQLKSKSKSKLTTTTTTNYSNDNNNDNDNDNNNDNNDYVLIDYKKKLNDNDKAKINTKNNNGFNSNKWWKIPFKIPIGDTIESKNIIKSLSGRNASIQRKQDSIPTPSLCISVWISEISSASRSGLSVDDNVNNDDDDDVAETETEASIKEIDVKKVSSSPIKEEEEVGNENEYSNTNTATTTQITISTVEDLSLEDLQRIINQTQHMQIQPTQTQTQIEEIESEQKQKSCLRRRTRTVEAVHHTPYQHPIDGRYARTYKVYYYDCITKAEAKKNHKLLREIIIPKYFPNVTIRY